MTTFDVDRLASALAAACPDVRLALLLGSARNGVIKPGADVDVALYAPGSAPLPVLQQAMATIAEQTGAEPDVGWLGPSEPVYRFEALNGRLLFCRDWEEYAAFFSCTCREYESQIAGYERQRAYRLSRSATPFRVGASL